MSFLVGYAKPQAPNRLGFGAFAFPKCSEISFKFIDVIQNSFFGGSVMPYNEANKVMYKKYTEHYKPDGETRFLAANPDSKVKGIGTLLLNELATREAGEEVYLYTDTDCTYQFYEHRGFERIGEQEIVLELQDGVAFKCLMYRKNCSCEQLPISRTDNRPLTTEYPTHQGLLFSHRKRLLFSFTQNQKREQSH